MIEKLTPDQILGLDGWPTTIMPDSAKLMGKINELCDAVNGILDYAPLEMAMKAEPKTPVDPYVEQHQWVGKLCKFWDYEDEEKWFSTLEHIDKNSPYPYCASGDWWYKHCEPVLPTDNVIYKGGNNE